MTQKHRMGDINVRYRYREIFFAHNGPGPYTCFGCDKQVTFTDVMVHHKDHNHDNNDPLNLVPAHRGCHRSYHATDRKGTKRGPNKKRDYVHTEEHKAKLKAAALKRYADRRAQGLTPFTDEHRAKISEKARARDKADQQ